MTWSARWVQHIYSSTWLGPGVMIIRHFRRKSVQSIKTLNAADSAKFSPASSFFLIHISLSYHFSETHRHKHMILTWSTICSLDYSGLVAQHQWPDEIFWMETALLSPELMHSGCSSWLHPGDSDILAQCRWLLEGRRRGESYSYALTTLCLFSWSAANSTSSPFRWSLCWSWASHVLFWHC